MSEQNDNRAGRIFWRNIQNGNGMLCVSQHRFLLKIPDFRHHFYTYGDYLDILIEMKYNTHHNLLVLDAAFTNFLCSLLVSTVVPRAANKGGPLHGSPPLPPMAFRWGRHTLV